MNVISLRDDHRHISAIHVAFFTVVESNNTNIFIMWRLKIVQYWLKFRLNGKTVMTIKYFKLKIVVLEYGCVEW